MLLSYLVTDWDEEDICVWLDRGGFSKYKKNFLSNHIDGGLLFDLTENDLEKELGIDNPSHRQDILKDISFLKKIYSKNMFESKYIREKLLKFYERNQQIIFDNKDKIMPSPIQKPLNSLLSNFNIPLF
jgi:SAM domain (Sterile alpha motif).